MGYTVNITDVSSNIGVTTTTNDVSVTTNSQPISVYYNSIAIPAIDGNAATISVGNVTTGEAGSNASITNSGTDSAAVFNFVIPRGITGATGATGPQGPQGITGATGATGATGPQGNIGLTGPQGPQGIQGNIGPQGNVGATGATGPQGPQGIQGNIGPQGNVGATGATGPQGTNINLKGTVANVAALPSSGNSVADAYIIATGAPEPEAGNLYAWSSSNTWVDVGQIVGPKGDTGATGATGPTGSTGPQGIQGNIGPQGNVGATGPQGPQGIQGNVGATGATGVSISNTAVIGSNLRVTYSNATSIWAGTVVGATGATGPAAGASYEYNNTTTEGDPGPGKIRFNNVNSASVTEIYIDDTDRYLQDLTSWYSQWDDSNSTTKGQLSVNAVGQAGIAQFYVTAVSAQSGYYKITVTNGAGSGNWSGLNNSSVVVNFTRTGDRGDTGATGAQGIQGNIGPQGPQGNVGATGAQGIQGEIGPQGIQGNVGATGPQGIQGNVGATGTDGVSVTNATITSGNLEITLSNSAVINAGSVISDSTYGNAQVASFLAEFDGDFGGQSNFEANIVAHIVDASIIQTNELQISGTPITPYGNTQVAAYLTENPPASSYGNTQVESYLTSNGYTLTSSSADEGGELKFNKAATNTILTTGVTVDVYQNRFRIFETGGSNRGLYANIAEMDNSAGTEIGFRNIPQVAAGNVTLALSDSGKHLYDTSAAPLTVTIPNNSNVAFAIGTVISLVNHSTGNLIVGRQNAVNLFLGGNATSAGRTVTTYGVATLMKVATDTWFINGVGVV